jgi:hypothetical protein
MSALADAIFDEIWQTVEITDWFDWINREASFGRVLIPQDEEQLVLVVARGIQRASQISGALPSCSNETEEFLIQAAILCECWSQAGKSPILSGENRGQTERSPV